MNLSIINVILEDKIFWLFSKSGLFYALLIFIATLPTMVYEFITNKESNGEWLGLGTFLIFKLLRKIKWKK